jgi:succinoglycan biosynthesis transport protein ExoP
MSPSERDDDSRSGSDVLGVVRRRAWVVVLLTIVCGGVAYGVARAQPKQYTAAALLLFQPQQVGQQLLGYAPSPTVNDAGVIEATNVALASAPGVINTTASRLGLSSSAVADAIEVAPAGSSQVVTVAATTTTPTTALRLASTYARVVVDSRRATQRAALVRARQQLQALLDRLQSSRGDATQVTRLKSRLTQVGLLAAAQTGDVQIGDAPVKPTKPSGPRVNRDAAFGVLLGLIIGLITAALLERGDRRVRDEDDLGALYGLPVLARIPQAKALTGSVRPRSSRRDPGVAEAFRLLRMRLRYFDVDGPLRTLLVTSALPREGKSTVALNLAQEAAAMATDHPVLLIEADLRRPTVAATTGLSVSPGLAQALTQLDDWRDAVQVQVQMFDVGTGRARGLHVLTAGDLPPNPTQLVESDRLRSLLAEASEQYELVIIDAPPPLVVADALALIRRVDGVVVVGRLDHAHRDAVTRLRATLSELDAPVLGVVANGLDRTDGSYGYRSYESPPGGMAPERSLSSS